MGHDLQLVDDDDGFNGIPMSQAAPPGRSDLTAATEQPTPTSRYPKREHRAPSRYNDFVSPSCVDVFLEKGGDITVIFCIIIMHAHTKQCTC